MRMGFWGMNNKPLPSSSSSSSPAAIIITTTLVLCFIVRVSSNETSSAALTLGYEQVATVYLGGTTGTWDAPCFLQNSARVAISVLPWAPSQYYGHVYITPHYGRCWTCRDDYQIKLGDNIKSTGSTYFGSKEALFSFYIYGNDEKKKLENEGMKIFVDKNAACNGVSRKTMKNPFGDMEFVAMN
ncbi:unnamed protein product [Cuscuta campestris]|uniref:Uncharacterized protein n=1 Tax=Cuscuta campestris TaxID=132261 RepID=A0A484NHW3_9ASTE|nr:unnamed protein product [Cuscuta campestris]